MRQRPLRRLRQLRVTLHRIDVGGEFCQQSGCQSRAPSMRAQAAEVPASVRRCRVARPSAPHRWEAGDPHMPGRDSAAPRTGGAGFRPSRSASVHHGCRGRATGSQPCFGAPARSDRAEVPGAKRVQDTPAWATRVFGFQLGPRAHAAWAGRPRDSRGTPA